MSILSQGPAPTKDIHVDVLAGHLGHLTEEQQKAFATFKDNLTKSKLFIPAAEGDSHPASHDESTLLYVYLVQLLLAMPSTNNSRYLLSLRRFLRARRFDPLKAQKQFSDAEAWRAKHDVDELYATFPSEELESSKRFYTRWTGRRDKVCLN